MDVYGVFVNKLLYKKFNIIFMRKKSQKNQLLFFFTLKSF